MDRTYIQNENGGTGMSETGRSQRLPGFATADWKPHHAIGSVPYLHARPPHSTIQEPVTFLEPNQLVVELARGRLQAALVPVVEVLENADAYHIVDGVAIGSPHHGQNGVFLHALPV